MYELAATVTQPGSDRQKIHADVPFNKVPLLYVVFVALQDININMGPTTFIPGSHTEATINIWNNHSKRDAYLSQASPVMAALKTGDVVVFDTRTLHCGSGNLIDKGSTRVLFNLSFRNPAVTGDLGVGDRGSIRPYYVDMLSLGQLSSLLKTYKSRSNVDPFAHLGDGLLSLHDQK
jgi:ectoine hydroxylase-related dioxygenase (phytanoyl-CoA dioxygenase family)